MKYIKKFENKRNSKRKYWLLPTDDRFVKSLKQINCTDRKIRGFLDSSSLKECKYIFVGYDNSNNNFNVDDKWGWNEHKNKLTDNYYEDNNYKFMGIVNIDDSELAANKFNI